GLGEAVTGDQKENETPSNHEVEYKKTVGKTKRVSDSLRTDTRFSLGYAINNPGSVSTVDRYSDPAAPVGWAIERGSPEYLIPDSADYCCICEPAQPVCRSGEVRNGGNLRRIAPGRARRAGNQYQSPPSSPAWHGSGCGRC